MSSSAPPFASIAPFGHAGGNDRPAKRKRENTRQACAQCRRNRSKCDSVRPTCGPCADRGRDCEYEFSQPGVSRQSAMKARLDHLEALFKQLKQATASKAQRLFQGLRSNVELQNLLESLDVEDGGDGEVDEEDPTPSTLGQQKRILSDLATEKQSVPSHERQQITTPPTSGPVGLSASQITEPTQHLTLSIDIPNATITQAAVDNFFSCAGNLLHVFSREQAKQFQQHVFESNDRDAYWRASVCCLCALAAIGKAYDQSPNASGSSRRYYEVSKSLFEDLIEVRSLDGTKVCSLLALFNIFDKATLAIIHVEVGMSLARYYGLEQNCKLVNMTDKQWIDYRKTWRTLLFFKSWLCFTLGYMAGDDVFARDDIKPEQLEIPDDGALEDLIQTETAKISLIKAKILRMDLAFNGGVAARTVQDISGGLEDWLRKLPPPMRLEALRDGREMSQDHRRSIYYVHLLYQGARMLLYRRVLSQHFDSTPDRSRLHEPVPDSPVMLQALADGRKVADMTSHTLRILQDENGVFKRCWLVIFQAFTSASLILYEAAQKQLHKRPAALWKKDLDMAFAPLATLKFCAELDPVALKFHQVLQPFHVGMSAYTHDATAVESAMTPQEPGPYNVRYLCEMPEVNPELNQRAQNLRAMLCRPFGAPQQKVNHLELSQLDWHIGSSIPFHWNQNFKGIGGENAAATDISQNANAFLGDTVHPSGWTSPPPGALTFAR